MQKGATGLRGPRGIPGPPGPSGGRGVQGPRGLTGSKGVQGEPGTKGTSERSSKGGARQRSKAVADLQRHIDRIDQQLDIQLKRMSQIQVELDELREKVSRL